MALNQIPVIVCNCYELGLGLIRSLGEKGVPIIGLYTRKDEFGRHSKYLRQAIKSPPIIKGNKQSEEKFIEFLLKNGPRWRGSLILPTNDQFIEALSKYKKKLSQYYVVGVQDWSKARMLVDKKTLYNAAESAGVPIPKTWYPTSLEFLYKHQKEFIFPCILKPRESHAFYLTLKKKCIVVNSFQELINTFVAIKKHKFQMMIQEIIPGRDDTLYSCIFYVSPDRKNYVHASVHKLRLNPPGFGVTRVCKNVDVPKLRSIGLKLIRMMKLTGPLSVDFKRDARDGSYKLLEINGRFVLYNRLLTKAGANIPYLMYNNLLHGKKVKLSSLQRCYWIHLLEDVRNITSHRNQEKYFTLAEYLKPYCAKNKTFAILDWSDMLPFLSKLTLYPFQLLKKIKTSFEQ